MRKTRTTIVAALAAALAVAALTSGIAVAGTAARADVVPFKATYAGKATVKVTDDVADISADGTGTATILGASKITGKGKGDASKQPCVPFTGTGAITASSGSLSFTVVPGATGCGDEAGKVFSVVGRAKVTGGTGKLAKATGTLKLTGVYDRGAGTFSIKFTGNLTVGAATPAKTTVLRISASKTKLAFSKKALVAPAGKIKIVMANPSPLAHNVAIRKGVTAKSKLIAKGKVVKKGGVSTVNVTLTKGKYRFVCTVPGHEAGGMWGILTVK